MTTTPMVLKLRGLPAERRDSSPARGRETYAQGTLALDFSLPSGVPAIPAPPDLEVLPGGRTGRIAVYPNGLPDVRKWAACFVQAIVEVIGGDRPPAQLVRWTSEAVYADISRRLAILGPASAPGRRDRSSRPQVRSVHICQPRDLVAEIAAHIRHGERSRAVAARLEVVQERWLCTALCLL